MAPYGFHAFDLAVSAVFELFFHFFQCHFQGVPSQGGAFDADGHLGDVFQGDGGFQFFQLGVVGDFAADHVQEEATEAEAFFHGSSLEEFGHHGGGGLTDGTAGAGVGQVFDNALFYFGFDVDVVAAAGVMSMFVDIGVFDFAFIGPVLVVFQDKVGVKLF